MVDHARRAFAGVLLAVLVACGSTSATPPAPQTERVHTPNGSGGANHPSVLDRPYVVLVSFDGIRPDYLERTDTPRFDRLVAAGVSADGLISVFPSLTFPSHYSIATGAYPERHGIVGNRFYDPVRDQEFDYREQVDAQDGSWWGGEPIWVTAEQQGMVAAAMYFPGTEAAIQGIRPTIWHPYDSGLRNRERVARVLGWLARPPEERPHLITLYFSLVDGAGHRQGPDHTAVTDATRGADRLLGRLLDGVTALPHGNQVYVVVVSDHGMAVVDPDRQVILQDIVDLRGIRAIPAGPGMTLFVDDPTRARTLRDRFNAGTRDARAYLREEVPAHLHHRASRRIGDVVIVPDEGVMVSFGPGSSAPAGMHGWDPTLRSMHGIFMMQGPGVPAGRRIEPFESVHVYPLVAHLLRLEPHAEIDGSLDVLRPLVGP